MFNNIIYFIVVLLIFSVGSAEIAPPFPFSIFLVSVFSLWAFFAGLCYFRFRALFRAIVATQETDGYLTRLYHGSITRLSMASIVVFAIDVYLLNIKYWLGRIPWFTESSLLQGLVGLGIFMFFLCTVWIFAYPCYRSLFRSPISRASYVLGQVRLNFPILLPWMVLSFVYDLISLSQWQLLKSLLDRPVGQIVFFAVFLGVLMVFMPRWVQFLWGCKPLEDSEKLRELKRFLAKHGFKYRDILRWPVFEGRMLTAGIMGLVGRYRYILVTDSLMDLLSTEELKAVLAHEMGHARYKHLVFYLIFFVGFIAMSLGLFDIFFYLVASQPFFLKMLTGQSGGSINLFYLALSLPMLITLVLYFRYIMGFFMRNFERQADLYSAKLMGTPRYTIDSLEKIALWSGKSRDIPSWHHFSIRERVECLKRMAADPGIATRHNRFVLLAFVIYVLCVGALTYELNFAGATERFSQKFLVRVLEREAEKEPSNTAALEALAMLYHKSGDVEKALRIYRKILSIQPNNTVALNNLAWILATNPDKTSDERREALTLAKRAVALRRDPTYLDTLAEAYFVNGQRRKAIETAKEALALARKNRDYFVGQLKKFESTQAPR
ncbi:MAG: hypothetical protein DRH12_00140 [Deltaproteobacteria bacterium]|nr:MAG: hypothetical protein DRH12_00140 [Deltaproteobacteria bacterium]